MSEDTLGRLERVKLRDIWPNESANFTPWLEAPNNLAVLSDALDLSLESQARETPVGDFSADLLCKNIDDNFSVIIENQFEHTDHDHLGKLLTYAAGLQAKTVVWIAETIRPEHSAAIDWLNDVSREDVRFFGVEIELFRIGDSKPAPHFKVVSRPNDWARRVSTGRQLTETQELQVKFWTQFLQYLSEHYRDRNSKRIPPAQHWMNWYTGIRGITFNTVIAASSNYMRVELYIDGEVAEQHFRKLEEQKDDIEARLEFKLLWGDQAAETRGRRISYYQRDVDISDESDWHTQHRWLASNLQKFYDVLLPVVSDVVSQGESEDVGTIFDSSMAAGS